MSNRISLFAQKRTVKIGEVDIQVNQMTWKDAILFGAEIANRSALFLENLDAFTGIKEKFLKIKDGENEGFKDSLNQLTKVIIDLLSGDSGLVKSFVSKLTDLTDEEVDHVPVGGLIEIVEVGIELNFSEGVVKKFSKLMAKVGAMGAKPDSQTIT